MHRTSYVLVVIFLYIMTFSINNEKPRNITTKPLTKPRFEQKCDSVFKLGQIRAGMSEEVKESIGKIVESEESKMLIIKNEWYGTLAQYFPSMIDRKKEKYEEEWPYERTGGYFPHLSCKLRLYDTKMLEKCVYNRQQKGKRTHIYLVGDSRIRNIALAFLDVFGDLKFKVFPLDETPIDAEDFITKIPHEILKKYFKAETPKLANLEFEFLWSNQLAAPNIGDNGIYYSVFENVKKKDIESTEHYLNIFKDNILDKMDEMIMKKEEELPSLIIMSTAAWELKYRVPFVRALDNHIYNYEKNLRQRISKISNKTEVVWMKPDSLNDIDSESDFNFLTSNSYPKQLEWFYSAQIQLKPPGLTVWDSFYPIGLAATRDCYVLPDNIPRPSHPLLRNLTSWNCIDEKHPSNHSLVLATQMIVNHLCNAYLPPQGYCCEAT